MKRSHLAWTSRHIVLDPGLDSGELAHLIDAMVVDGSLNLDADLVTVGHARSNTASSPYCLSLLPSSCLAVAAHRHQPVLESAAERPKTDEETTFQFAQPSDLVGPVPRAEDGWFVTSGAKVILPWPWPSLVH